MKPEMVACLTPNQTTKKTRVNLKTKKGYF